MSTEETQEAVKGVGTIHQARTRAEIQAEIEKLQEELAWKPGDRVACLGVITGRESYNRTHSVQFDNTVVVNQVQASAFIPAADLIHRVEHEAALAEARAVDAKNATVPHDHFIDANKMVEPADAEPIGYANRMSDGAWSGVYASRETAQSVAQYGGWVETAVPLYRHPVPPVVTAVAPKGVVEFLSDIFEQAINAYTKECGEPLCCTCQKYRDEARAALSRITELPEPSKWAVSKAESICGPMHLNLSSKGHLSLAAALLERAALLESEGDHD